MKRILVLLFLVVITIAGTVLCTAAQVENTPTSCFTGDTNGDGEINVKDLTRLKRYLAEDGTQLAVIDATVLSMEIQTADATAVFSSIGDTNGDGAIAIKDLTRLQKYISDESLVTLADVRVEMDASELFTMTQLEYGYRISEYTGNYKGVMIPKSYLGEPVAAIQAGTFANAEGLLVVSFENGYGWTVGDTAMDVTNATMMAAYLMDTYSNVSWVHTHTFTEGLVFESNTNNAAGTPQYSVTGYTGSNTAVVIPAVYKGLPVTRIGGSAFLQNYAITSVSIPDSVTNVGTWAFAGCTNLTSVTVGRNVTAIESDAFGACFKLVEVFNRSGLSLAKGNDYGHVSSYALEVHSGDGKIDSKVDNVDDYLFYTYEGTHYLLGYVGTETELILPANYNGEQYDIYKYAFFHCGNMASVIIPDSVTSIGNYAFDECSGLTHITISDGVTHIGWSAFDTCSSLTSVTIPDSVVSIGGAAFNACSGLTHVTIGTGVTQIEEKAFLGCSKLTSATFKVKSGWVVNNIFVANDTRAVLDTDLADSATAASYLTSKYSEFFEWTCD